MRLSDHWLRMRILSFLPLFVLLLTALPAAAGDPSASPACMPLTRVRTFMYQLQGIENPAAVAALAKSDYDLLVVEPTGTVRDQATFDMKGMVAKLHEGKSGRIVLAYLDAGQAESFRGYWKPDWKAPTRTARGNPDFILIPDPDGWSDDYVVAYWDPRWQQTIAGGKDSQVRAAMAAGFDGVYLDWIDAYSDDRVVEEAKKEKVDPAHAMVDFLLLIRKSAREINPAALVVQQNAIELIDADPRLLDAIDALGVEDTWFAGKSNAKWGTKNAGDVANRYKDESSTAGRLKQYAKYQKAGKPVLSIDYCLKPKNAAMVYEEARKHGLIPLVSQVPLDRLTETPPP
jgi:cysteinyl-tRNA synthetase